MIFIELKYFVFNFIVCYEFMVFYCFLEDKNYFIIMDEKSFLVYDFDNWSEYYIGNIGEFLVDRKLDYIVYIIVLEDKWGNGIYLYDFSKMIIRVF